MVIETIAELDTYIYAIAALVFWNFIWTKKLRNKVFGDGKDPTEKGLAKDVEKLEERIDSIENE